MQLGGWATRRTSRPASRKERPWRHLPVLRSRVRTSLSASGRKGYGLWAVAMKLRPLKGQTGHYVWPLLQAGLHYNPLFPRRPLRAVRWRALCLSTRLPRRGALKGKDQVCAHAVVKCPNFRGQHSAQANEYPRRKPGGPLEGGGLCLYYTLRVRPATAQLLPGAGRRRSEDGRGRTGPTRWGWQDGGIGIALPTFLSFPSVFSLVRCFFPGRSGEQEVEEPHHDSRALHGFAGVLDGTGLGHIQKTRKSGCCHDLVGSACGKMNRLIAHARTRTAVAGPRTALRRGQHRDLLPDCEEGQ